ncbi:MAG: WecB/TagA/CpsF family glycosyltransferase [Cyclobacteriaceae bacterium]|nr:WecB/TagA/CpsF family glycosyltransferase [Cyclobacteriaceae bacterium]
MDTNTVNILSVNVSTSDLYETIQIFKQWIKSGEKKRVCVTPVNCILWAYKNKSLRELYNTSAMNLADGVPLIWASGLLGNRIRGRVTGLDLLPEFSKVGNIEKYRFFFLGAKEGVAETLAQQFLYKFPDLKIVGTYSPPFAEKFSDDENEKMISLVNTVKPNVLWVSLTAPKQDYWIFENFDRLNVNIAIGVGGAFEVTAGLIKRAPGWMQRSGLEWFFRFLQEPRRLFKRYFVEAPQFIPLLFLQKVKTMMSNFK